MLSPDTRLAVEKAEPLDLLETETLPGTKGAVCRNMVVPLTVPHGTTDLRRAGAREIVDVVDFCLN